MAIIIEQVGGFIPQSIIKITDNTKNAFLSNIKIERKVGSAGFETIMQTDSDTTKYQFHDINDFGKVYEYKVSYEVYQKQAYKNTSASRKNYWTENWNLGDLKVSSDGILSGTGTATAKSQYLNNLNKNGTHVVNLSAWIGTGGDNKGFNGGYEVIKIKGKGKNKDRIAYKQLDKNTYDNIIVYFDYGNYHTSRSVFFTKAWANSKAWSKRFWMFINKRDVDNKRNQIKLFKDGADGFDLRLFFRKRGNAYDYGLARAMASMSTTQGLSTKGGKCTRFRIALKNGAKVRPDFTTTVTSGTMYRYVKVGSYSKTQRIIARDEPDVDYGIFINELGEGFRFNQYESNGIISTGNYTTKSTTQMLEIQGSTLPIAYINDNRKTPSIDFTILVDNIAYRNRIREKVLIQNYVYLFVPKRWNYQINTGFYAYEKCEETRLDENIYSFSFTGARVVQGNVTKPPKWTYRRLADGEKNYITTLDNYKDYSDLAVSPLGGEIIGQKE